MAHYSQISAYKALMIGSLKSILKSPSSVIFTIAFPLIFIVALGWFDKETENIHPKIISLIDQPAINAALSTKEYWDFNLASKDTMSIADLQNQYDIIISGNPPQVHIDWNEKLLTHHSQYTDLIQSLLQPIINHESIDISYTSFTPATIQAQKKIDYILPGQLGFSLLAASIFGTAFVFFSLRHTYVLKRFFATPIRSITILLAEGTSRLLFQIFGAFLLILIGYWAFDFSLPNGILSVIMMLGISLIAIISFMSFGFIISGLAKSESTVPPLANIIVLPQFIMSDTFIPIQDMPAIIQSVAQFLPLTHFNQAIRAFAQNDWSLIPWSSVSINLLVVIIWGIIGYFLATKTFKWE